MKTKSGLPQCNHLDRLLSAAKKIKWASRVECPRCKGTGEVVEGGKK